MTPPAVNAEALPWSPLAPKSSASFCTHRLRVDGERLEFVAQRGTKLFIAAFFLFGIVFEVIGIGLLAAPVPKWAPLIPLAGGMLFIGGGLYLRKRFMGLRRFDLERGLFETVDGQTELSEVIALQLLTHRVGLTKNGSDGPNAYTSHELNLVLEGEERLYVMGHSGLDELRHEAGQLAERLGVELLDRA